MMRTRHIHATVMWLLVWGLAACGAGASRNAAAPDKPECPTPPPLPLCPAAGQAVTHDLAALLALEGFSGAAVVEGRLHVSPVVTCTEEACPSVDPCCNSCGAPLVLTPTAEKPSYEDESGYLTLYPAASGASYGCSGSDCGLCCNVETGGMRVRASGRADIYDTKSMSLEFLCAVP